MATLGATAQWLGTKTKAEQGHAHPKKAKGRWRGGLRKQPPFLLVLPSKLCLTTLNPNWP